MTRIIDVYVSINYDEDTLKYDSCSLMSTDRAAIFQSPKHDVVTDWKNLQNYLDRHCYDKTIYRVIYLSSVDHFIMDNDHYFVKDGLIQFDADEAARTFIERYERY